ncbi:zinc finger protein 43 [Drosophila ananassae]|nr:zinc finger protein 43 [Drosophila ananassae]XP_032311931.1 zinc finger protein 43 [Drosophila ananassae]
MSSNTCDTCGKQFSKPTFLRRHQVVHTKDKLFACDFCFRSFSQLSSLQRHKRSNHSENETLKCHSVVEDADQVVHQALTALRSLQSGMDAPSSHRSAKELPLSCQLVELRPETSLMNQRSQLPVNKKYYVCDLCGKEFCQLHDLIRHRRSHPKEKAYPCLVCLKLFATKSYLIEHKKQMHRKVKKHKKEINLPFQDHFFKRIYKCLYCEKMYKQKFNCRRHMLVHFSQRWFKNGTKKRKIINKNCETCGKSFKKSNDLKRHMLTHSRIRPQTCHVCQKSFSLKATLSRHMLVHQMQRLGVNCQVCGKSYSSKTALRLHLRIHTGERPFICEICQQTFRTSGHRLEHMRAERHRSKPTSTILC